MTIPNDNNLHATIKNCPSKNIIAERYSNRGWSVHFPDQITLEVESDIAELTFHWPDTQGVLVTGGVTDIQKNFVSAVSPLLEIGVNRHDIVPDEKIDGWP